RGPLTTAVCVLGFLGSIVFTTRAGLLWLDIVDHFLTHYGLVLVGILECIVIGWFFDLPMLRHHVNRISSIQLGGIWDILVKGFVPLVLIVIMAGDLYQDITQPYGDYSWTALILIGRDWLLINLALAVFLASRPWRTENHRRPGRGLL
ncbi:MAG TPA: sodium-dependent transporter, partial [Methylothermaceae bacterium]|nr:sodium-dependent transporter [Methylothermaceae bacterium]